MSHFHQHYEEHVSCQPPTHFPTCLLGAFVYKILLQRRAMKGLTIFILILCVALIRQCSASCRNFYDCRNDRVCCFGRCATECSVKAVPPNKCTKEEDCSFNEHCTAEGYCAEYGIWPQQSTSDENNLSQRRIEQAPVKIPF
ncbi:hypothetical protein Tcan_02775 [Toxocara canis]|uniref:WAP domain-containing protein n=1 Tax=Toxocara canis TaxID=6265 RepID=A0A0B2VLI5_TOXCA|nr:hypothetical protein Tcan_02775 [Toxocara canis]